MKIIEKLKNLIKFCITFSQRERETSKNRDILPLPNREMELPAPEIDRPLASGPAETKKETSEEDSSVTASQLANRSSSPEFNSIITSQNNLSSPGAVDNQKQPQWSGRDSNPQIPGDEPGSLPINLPPRSGAADKSYHENDLPAAERPAPEVGLSSDEPVSAEQKTTPNNNEMAFRDSKDAEFPLSRHKDVSQSSRDIAHGQACLVPNRASTLKPQSLASGLKLGQDSFATLLQDNYISDKKIKQTKNPASLQDFEDSTLQGISRVVADISSIANQKILSSPAGVNNSNSEKIKKAVDLEGVAPSGSRRRPGMPLLSRPTATPLYHEEKLTASAESKEKIFTSVLQLRCPYCGSEEYVKRGTRRKKRETVQLYLGFSLAQKYINMPAGEKIIRDVKL